MHELLQIIVVAGAIGLIPLFIPRKGSVIAGIITLLASIWLFVQAYRFLGAGEVAYNVALFDLGGQIPIDFALRLTAFSSFILVFISLFGVLITLYSLGYLRGSDRGSIYYSYILWTLAAASGAVLADNLLIMLIFWEMLTAILFFLINMGGKGHEKAAAKAFTLLGFTDASMLLGIILIWVRYGTVSISRLSAMPIETTAPVMIIAFICMFAGAIAKTGGMPFHSWIPEMAKPTPALTIAFLPASLDKLLGIYLLGMLTFRIFDISAGSPLSIMMMIVGAGTLIFAVLMALVQHDLKKLLSFHAVSQVGYMVLGVGSCIPVAMAGGLFHMVNNAIYKSGLFLGAGAVEKQTGTTDLEKLGGLARLMPVTFITMVITAFSISGVPPFNGFVSKWLVYQGMLEGHTGYHMVFLIIAIFGSALTLASFIKVLHSIFLGRRSEKFDHVREVGFTMQLPMIFLAVLCVAFGIFARYPLERFIMPVLTQSGIGIDGSSVVIGDGGGFWNPTLATVLMLLGLVVGFIIYALAGVRKKIRVDENPWVGGNIMDNDEMAIPGTHFYKTVTDDMNPFFSGGFRDGDSGAFDVFNIFGKLGDVLVQFLRKMHDGILSTYLSWAVIGLGVLAFILMFKW
ncbi:MAG: NADH-quinone oxidoreductase subunit L [Candidatus Krumholzibacteriota bacterium]|nr:NADH-quinone oxidoreductase subunit L [Candidatus Krumholzibacteriota bacterium]